MFSRWVPHQRVIVLAPTGQEIGLSCVKKMTPDRAAPSDAAAPTRPTRRAPSVVGIELPPWRRASTYRPAVQVAFEVVWSAALERQRAEAERRQALAAAQAPLPDLSALGSPLAATATAAGLTWSAEHLDYIVPPPKVRRVRPRAPRKPRVRVALYRPYADGQRMAEAQARALLAKGEVLRRKTQTRVQSEGEVLQALRRRPQGQQDLRAALCRSYPSIRNSLFALMQRGLVYRASRVGRLAVYALTGAGLAHVQGEAAP